jgi:hypothetical protein
MDSALTPSDQYATFSESNDHEYPSPNETTKIAVARGNKKITSSRLSQPEGLHEIRYSSWALGNSRNVVRFLGALQTVA